MARNWAWAAVAAWTVVGGAMANAQETPSPTTLTTDHYFDLEKIDDAQISPDGTQVIYVRQQANRIEDRWDIALWIVNADGSHNRLFAKGSSARWSPDGKRILYLADGDAGKAQIFVRYVDVDGPATPVTHGTEAVANPRWAPDGRSIAFTMFVAQKPNWAISLPPEPKGAKWMAAPRIVDKLHYRFDRIGFVEDGVDALFVVAADGGATRQITDQGTAPGAAEFRGPIDFAWSPDSKSIVFAGIRDFNADLAYQHTQLLVTEVASGRVRDLLPVPGDWSRPTVSPDGRWIAFTGYPKSEKTHSVADLYVIPAGGGEMRKISGDLDRDPIGLKWAADSSGVYFDVEDHGSRNVLFAALKGGVRVLTRGAHMLSLDSVSRDLTAAGTLSDTDHPAEVVRYSLRRAGEPALLTHVNAALVAGKTLGHTQAIDWQSSGGTKVEGWYITPPGFDPGKKYPLILEIHGGPYASYNTGFSYMWQNFAANGYVVLYLNPRGSTGYGHAFSDGIDHDYPGPDLDDLLSGVDALAAKGFVDTARLHVSGCSGGGVLSSWVTSHSDRFAAAAVRCPVTDWVSLAGHTDVPLFTYSFFKKPFWEDPSDWLSHSSLMHVGKVTTPTLLMTGVLDRRTPMPQTEEYYAALKVRGIPATLLQFEGEFHGTGSKPSNFIRTQLYMMSWFKRYSRGADGKVREN